jgi:phage tail sheath protein FI
MPEYLAPGVYIEETSFRAKTIEGVSTSTAGFVGPTTFGPIRGEPELLTSYADFERIHGGLDRLQYAGGGMDNWLAHAVRAFFEEGGRRLYVARVYQPPTGSDGRASARLTDPDNPGGANVVLRARHPGAVANRVPVGFAFRAGQNILVAEPVNPSDPQSARIAVLRGAAVHDLVLLENRTGAVGSPAPAEGLYWLQRTEDGQGRRTFALRTTSSEDRDSDPDAIVLTSIPADEVDDFRVRVLTTTVTVGPLGELGQPQSWGGLTFHPQHRQSLTRVFAARPAQRSTELYTPLVVESSATNGVDIAGVLLAQTGILEDTAGSPVANILDLLRDENASDAARSFQAFLIGGSDGARPPSLGDDGYEGESGDADGLKSGFRALEDIEDISIVAAPGSTHGYAGNYRTDADTIQRLLISHCERMRYRVAVLDAPPGQVLSDIRAFRGQLDSTHAALYYPWVRVLDPLSRQEIDLPPSGFVAGIYARNDVEHGVHKAPANEVVRSAIGFEVLLNTAQQDVLNPEGINCFRFFEGRGYRLWGARTISSDSERWAAWAWRSPWRNTATATRRTTRRARSPACTRCRT